jgi:hypothetical protein
MWFLYVEWQIQRVPDTRPKPDGYGYEFLPTGMGTDINFYQQALCWRMSNCSTRSKSDPLPSLLSAITLDEWPRGHTSCFIDMWLTCVMVNGVCIQTFIDWLSLITGSNHSLFIHVMVSLQLAVAALDRCQATDRLTISVMCSLFTSI